jgi:hypothetical protein
MRNAYLLKTPLRLAVALGLGLLILGRSNTARATGTKTVTYVIKVPAGGLTGARVITLPIRYKDLKGAGQVVTLVDPASAGDTADVIAADLAAGAPVGGPASYGCAVQAGAGILRASLTCTPDPTKVSGILTLPGAKPILGKKGQSIAIIVDPISGSANFQVTGGPGTADDSITVTLTRLDNVTTDTITTAPGALAGLTGDQAAQLLLGQIKALPGTQYSNASSFGAGTVDVPIGTTGIGPEVQADGVPASSFSIGALDDVSTVPAVPRGGFLTLAGLLAGMGAFIVGRAKRRSARAAA